MSKLFRPWPVDQGWLLPPSVHDFVPPGHLAHFIRDLVRDQLDLEAILSSYTEARGYPPFHPAMMVALLLFAYCQGVYSSRRIARACEERVDFMAVTGMQRPDFRTINEFRRRHLRALGGLFTQVLRLCRRAGLVKFGHVALDGTKIRANASKHKAMSHGRMAKAEARLEAEVAAWFAAADAADVAEDSTFGADRRGDEMPDWVADKQRRLTRLREARAALEAEAEAKAEAAAEAKTREAASGAGGVDPDEPAEPKPARRGRPARTPAGTPPETAQRNFTDPDSRIMKTKDGFIQGYNAQAAVDSGDQVIVACDLSNHGSDQDALIPLVDDVKATLGRKPVEVSADAGYCSERTLAGLEERRINAYVATGRQKHGTPDAAGRRDAKPGTRVAAMQQKLRRGGWSSRYRLRKQVVEPVFGQIKHARGFRQFLLRGLHKVKEEWRLVCTAHNLLKLARAAG